MPELPELRLAAQFITRVCRTAVFAAPIVKSAVSTRNPDVALPEAYRRFRVSSESRGKELLLILRRAEESAPAPLVSKTAGAVPASVDGKRGTKTEKGGQSTASSSATPASAHAPVANTNASTETSDSVLKIIFRFGMSGHFFFGEPSQLPAHAHLMLRTEDGQRVLAFVDPRRWGHWALAADFDRRTRGPDATTEFAAFREHVRASLVGSSAGGRSAAAFDVPICEMLLDQRYFNGIGNYLRAEILHRAGVRPFERARDALTRCFAAHELSTAVAAEPCESAAAASASTRKRGQAKVAASASSAIAFENISPLLSLCHSVPLEVVDLNLNYFAPDLSGGAFVFFLLPRCDRMTCFEKPHCTIII
jgi:endonuclease VIII-like 1